MGSILKLVYSNNFFHNNKVIRLSNGLPKILVDHIKNCASRDSNFDVNHCISEIEKQNPSWRGNFQLSNLYTYFQKFYSENLIISTDDVVDNEDVVYVYPVEIIAMTTDALSEKYSLTIDSQTENYNFIDTIEPKTLELMRKGKIKIAVCNIQDPCTGPGSIIKFENLLRSAGISESNLIFIFGNRYLTHKNYYPNSKTKFTFGRLTLQQQAADIEGFPRITSLGYQSDIFRKEDLDNLRHVLRPKKFSSFNRSLRSHKYYLAFLAQKYNFIDQGIFSFLNNNENFDHVKKSLEKFEGTTIDVEECLNLLKSLPIELDTQHLNEAERGSFPTNNNKKEWFSNSYIHITSETIFDVNDINEPFFSEKTFRPITNLQPFIMLGNAYSLKKLHELGFKTFHPFIDESYDNVSDPSIRMRLIKKEILKLAELSTQQVHDLYYSFEDILLHNFNILKSFKDVNPFREAVEDMKSFRYE